MIIYTCPKCGADLREIVLTSYPPKYQSCCDKCGWTSKIKESQYIRLPYPEEIKRDFNYIPDCCKYCSNHPSNGGSGICHCTLPYMNQTTAKSGSWNYVITTSTSYPAILNPNER